MITFNNTQALQAELNIQRTANKVIAFVPTMGNLHDGHLSLVRLAQEHADIVVVSIFVNPLQFGANEDLDKYPRTLANDQALLIQENTHYLFTPSVDDIYPLGMENQTKVCVPNITRFHCGQSRPGHFDGVSTVVMKLFNIVQPHAAIFGQKDFQQLALIRKMVSDLCVPIKIIGAPTGRAEDGLALSSRNQYLNPEQRIQAAKIYEQLNLAKNALRTDPNQAEIISENCKKNLTESGFKVDYFNICDGNSLEPIQAQTSHIAILAAAFLGSTRLIDNISFFIEP